MAKKNPHAVALGRLGGRVMSERKLDAIRANAKRGGRRPKFVVGDGVRVNDKAPREYRGRLGAITTRGPGHAVYQVAFRDGQAARSGQLMSWWLEPTT